MANRADNALVTGASRGIGEAIALSLGAAGYRVFVNYRADSTGAYDVVSRIEAAGGTAVLAQGDVGIRAEAEAVFAAIETSAGFIRYLVNNAGVTRDGPLMLMSDDDWNTVLRTNLEGTRLCSQLALRGMMHLGGGAITNIVSPSGMRGQAGQCNYSASKGGVIALTKSLAREMGRYGIRVNAVCPGLVETRMSASYMKRNGKTLLGQIPMGRFGTPEDIAPLVRFLGSDEASYITAQVIAIDGGLI